MIQVAIIFGMRFSVILLACAVVCAFFRPAVTWVSGCERAANAERLAAGVCMLGVGVIFAGIVNMAMLIFGQDVLGMYLGAGVVSIAGLAAVMLGFFLCITAWFSNRTTIPIKRVSAWGFLAALMTSGVGTALYYVLV